MRWGECRGVVCWPRAGLFGHREHSTPRRELGRSMCRGRDDRRMDGCLRPALAPDFQVGELAATSTALQGVGVAHGTHLVARDHPVVAGGTTVAAAVSGGGRVHREGGTQVLHSGGSVLGGVLVWDSGDRTKAPAFAQMRRESAGHGQGCHAPCGTSHTVAAGLRQRSRSHFLHPCPFSNGSTDGLCLTFN